MREIPAQRILVARIESAPVEIHRSGDDSQTARCKANARHHRDALARSTLADEAVNLPSPYVEIDTIDQPSTLAATIGIYDQPGD
jgi:hypothetical protein